MDFLADTLPAASMTAIIAIVGAAITIWLANRAGLGDISQAVDKETDRLVEAQAARIKLLEVEVADLREKYAASLAREHELLLRVDKLERLITDEQIKRVLEGKV